VMFRMAIGDEAREESRLDLHQARLIVYSQHTPCSQELRESHKIVIGDAMHTQRELSKQSIQARGDFVWVVKMNQPTLHEDLATLGGNRSSRPVRARNTNGPWHLHPKRLRQPSDPRQGSRGAREAHEHRQLRTQRLQRVAELESGLPHRARANRAQDREDESRGRIWRDKPGTQSGFVQVSLQTHPRLLGHRKRTTQSPRCHIQGRQHPSDSRKRRTCYGLPEQPCHRSPATPRLRQHCSGAPKFRWPSEPTRPPRTRSFANMRRPWRDCEVLAILPGT